MLIVLTRHGMGDSGLEPNTSVLVCVHEVQVFLVFSLNYSYRPMKTNHTQVPLCALPNF
jgi:hypothetical protein